MKPVRPRPGAATAAPGRIRLIAGRLRGSKLEVPDAPGLRPTSDRVRETLFNWLAPMLGGARVLDLFAGCGALGLEAASRGAAAVTLVERDPRLARALQANIDRLQVAQAQVVCADALAWLRHPPAAAFDLVFLDPPFAAGLMDEAVRGLLAPGWLAPHALLYQEQARDTPWPMPEGWAEHRAGQTRDVQYRLLRRAAG